MCVCVFVCVCVGGGEGAVRAAKGHLKLFRKFTSFGVARLPLGICGGINVQPADDEIQNKYKHIVDWPNV